MAKLAKAGSRAVSWRRRCAARASRPIEGFEEGHSLGVVGDEELVAMAVESLKVSWPGWGSSRRTMQVLGPQSEIHQVGDLGHTRRTFLGVAKWSTSSAFGGGRRQASQLGAEAVTTTKRTPR